ncbi:hypothetical protein PQX77_003647 [Marasmius sp. AFHP31]|nr:hypothetical protein PQX77_003647 [Marasmius sp. AFHP31]
MQTRSGAVLSALRASTSSRRETSRGRSRRSKRRSPSHSPVGDTRKRRRKKSKEIDHPRKRMRKDTVTEEHSFIDTNGHIPPGPQLPSPSPPTLELTSPPSDAVTVTIHSSRLSENPAYEDVTLVNDGDFDPFHATAAPVGTDSPGDDNLLITKASLKRKLPASSSSTTEDRPSKRAKGIVERPTELATGSISGTLGSDFNFTLTTNRDWVLHNRGAPSINQEQDLPRVPAVFSPSHSALPLSLAPSFPPSHHDRDISLPSVSPPSISSSFSTAELSDPQINSTAPPEIPGYPNQAVETNVVADNKDYNDQDSQPRNNPPPVDGFLSGVGSDSDEGALDNGPVELSNSHQINPVPPEIPGSPIQALESSTMSDNQGNTEHSRRSCSLSPLLHLDADNEGDCSQDSTNVSSANLVSLARDMASNNEEDGMDTESVDDQSDDQSDSSVFGGETYVAGIATTGSEENGDSSAEVRVNDLPPWQSISNDCGRDLHVASPEGEGSNRLQSIASGDSSASLAREMTSSDQEDGMDADSVDDQSISSVFGGETYVAGVATTTLARDTMGSDEIGPLSEHNRNLEVSVTQDVSSSPTLADESPMLPFDYDGGLENDSEFDEDDDTIAYSDGYGGDSDWSSDSEDDDYGDSGEVSGRGILSQGAAYSRTSSFHGPSDEVDSAMIVEDSDSRPGNNLHNNNPGFGCGGRAVEPEMDVNMDVIDGSPELGQSYKGMESCVDLGDGAVDSRDSSAGHFSSTPPLHVDDTHTIPRPDERSGIPRKAKGVTVEDVTDAEDDIRPRPKQLPNLKTQKKKILPFYVDDDDDDNDDAEPVLPKPRPDTRKSTPKKATVEDATDEDEPGRIPTRANKGKHPEPTRPEPTTSRKQSLAATSNAFDENDEIFRDIVMKLLPQVRSRTQQKQILEALAKEDVNLFELIGTIYTYMGQLPKVEPQETTAPVPESSRKRKSKVYDRDGFRVVKHRSQAQLGLNALVRLELRRLLQPSNAPLVTLPSEQRREWQRARYSRGGPTIKSFILDLSSHYLWDDNVWNQTAGDVFVEYFVELEGYDGYKREDVLGVFKTHLRSLRQRFLRQFPTSNHIDDQVEERRDQRKRNLFGRRVGAIRTCSHVYQSMAAFLSHGKLLTSDMMSGDETELEKDKNGAPKYLTLYQRWRSYEFSEFLHFLDALHMSLRYLGNGKYTVGQFPGFRTRSMKPDTAMMDPPVGLPENWYDKAYLDEEPDRRRNLQVKTAVPLRLPDKVLQLAKRFKYVQRRTDLPLDARMVSDD